MKLTQRISETIDYVAQLHQGQDRKGADLPYIVHPFSVGWIVQDYTQDEDVVIAALLHDVLEDAPGTSYQKMADQFGKKIAQIVNDVTEEKDPTASMGKMATWEARKQKYIDHLNAASREALLVCAADKIQNLRSLQLAYRMKGSAMWEAFTAPLDKTMWFYETVLVILTRRLDSPIVAELESTYRQAKELLESAA